MLSDDKIIKGYFTFVNLMGYFIILISNYNYHYSSGTKDFRWAISYLIGGFIVIFKNSKIIELKYKGLYYLFDTTMFLFIIGFIKFFPNISAILKLILLITILFFYLFKYYNLVQSNKITFYVES